MDYWLWTTQSWYVRSTVLYIKRGYSRFTQKKVRLCVYKPRELLVVPKVAMGEKAKRIAVYCGVLGRWHPHRKWCLWRPRFLFPPRALSHSFSAPLIAWATWYIWLIITLIGHTRTRSIVQRTIWIGCQTMSPPHAKLPQEAVPPVPSAVAAKAKGCGKPAHEKSTKKCVNLAGASDMMWHNI